MGVMGKKRMICRNLLAFAFVVAHKMMGANAFCNSNQHSQLPRIPAVLASRRSMNPRITSREPFTSTACATSDDECSKGGKDKYVAMNRREAMVSAFTSILTTGLMNPNVANADIEGVVAAPPPSTATPSTSAAEGGVTLFTTKSGLKYIDIKEGTGPTPKYGQLCSISYKAYVKLPDSISADKKISSKLQEYDSDKYFLVKHGNGRIIPGLDEGLHTLRVGGKRRIIIPPKLGFVSNGLGPLPETPWARNKLNGLLNQMVEVRGGNLVYDVELRSAFDDEADQGYYEDDALSPEEFQTLRENFERGAKEEREKQKVAADIGEV